MNGPPPMGSDSTTHVKPAKRPASGTDACLVCIYPAGPLMGRRYALRDLPILPK